MSTEDAVAFRKLQSYAARVAKEMASQGRPLDPLEGHSPPVRGWRVWQTDMSVTTRRGKDGYIGWYSTEVEWDSVWLETSGSLHRVRVRENIQAGNLAPRLTPSVHNRKEVSARPLTESEALEISGHPPWREKTYRQGSVEVFEGYRLGHRARPGSPPCLGMSKMLSDLRSGKQSSNIVTSYG